MFIEMFRISKIPIFESNSQPWRIFVWWGRRCSESQRYQFSKAIHNLWTSSFAYCFDVPNLKDTNFRKQFTTSNIKTENPVRCSESQRYQFSKAIHNEVHHGVKFFEDVPNLKDTNFRKQFTTTISEQFRYFAMFRISKIPIFESNSQHTSL